MAMWLSLIHISIAKEIIILQSGKIAAKDSVEALCSQFGEAKDLEAVYMAIFGEEASYV